jgi:hypothetical protein
MTNALNGQWIEVFRAGDYGAKGKFTAADLDKIVANYDPAKHEAPVTLGHPQHDAPAYGWTESLQRVGDTILAKLKQVPDAFAQLVADGRFKKRSIALYQGANGPALRHIGFLGAMPPEVKGLADVKLCEFGQEKFEAIDFNEEKKTVTGEEIKNYIAEAFKGLFGEKKPATFSEDDVKKFAAEAAKEATKELQTTLATQKTAFDDLQKKFNESQTSAALAGKSATAQSAIAKLKADHKWIPAFDKMGLPAIFSALALSTAEITFGEGEKAVKKTPLEVFADFMSGLQEIVPTKELSAAANSARKGDVIKFTEPNSSHVAIDDESVLMAEAATDLAKKEKISYGDALRRVRTEGVKKEGAASAAAV